MATNWRINSMRSFYGFSVQVGEGRDAVRGGLPTMDSFREWLLLAEARKAADIAREILGGDESLLNQIQGILPAKVPTKLQGKIVALAAFYYADMRVKDLNSLRTDIADYAKLVNDSKMPVLSVGDDLKVDNPHMSSHLGWTEVLHGKKYEDRVRNAPVQGDVSDQELMAQSADGKIKVYKANSANQCIILGKGESFCISQPANTMFQSYRDDKVSTFHFVYDSTRTDDLAIVVVDATRDRIELTDRANHTAKTMQDPFSPTEKKRIDSDPELYFRYLRERGIDAGIFRNIPKSPEEDAEQAKLGKNNGDLGWFRSLSPDEKSKYVGRGHALSDEQFDYVYENFASLMTQYAKTGLKVNDHQLAKITAKRDLKDYYLHNRVLRDSTSNDLSKQEYALLNPKQKGEVWNNTKHSKVTKAINLDELEMVKELVDKGEEIGDGFDTSIRNGNIEIVKYLMGKGADMGDGVELAATSGHFDIVKYLVEQGGQRAIGNAVEGAAKMGRLDIVKYLVGERGRIGDSVISTAAGNGHLDVVEYLVEKGGNEKIGNYAIGSAARSGRLDIVRHLVEKGGRIGDGAVSVAAVSGHIDVVKYLLGDEVAGKLGDVLKLPKGKAPGKIADSTIFNVTSNSNDLDLIKYLCEKGAKVEQHDIDNARTQEIKDYLLVARQEWLKRHLRGEV
jgi:hypothetical protein